MYMYVYVCTSKAGKNVGDWMNVSVNVRVSESKAEVNQPKECWIDGPSVCTTTAKPDILQYE